MAALDISIVTFNSASWLEGFFISLEKQTISTEQFNILICDHGSSDGTVDICREIGERLRGRFNSIIISEAENKGFGAGHNLNFSKSNSSYFLVANVDLEFEPNAIGQILREAEISEGNVAAWEFRQKPYEHPKIYDPVNLETRWNSSACVLFRRTAFAEVGGYEEKIFMYGEDVELSYRLRDRGYCLKYCPKAVCWHYTYSDPGMIKPLQYYGAILANLYIRLRYGSILNILAGYLHLFKLYFARTPLESRRKNLTKIFIASLRNLFYFLRSRKRTNIDFPFKGWDYELARVGAFYKYSQESLTNFPLISVIIRTQSGRLELLKEAIISVANQTYPNIELIVVEDGSDLARDHLKVIESKQIFFSVKYTSILRAGRCHAGNIGLSLAAGAFINFLDDDDLFYADHLEVLAAKLISNEEYSAAYSMAFSVPTKFINFSPLKYHEAPYEVFYGESFSRVKIWLTNYLPIQSVLFRKELFLRFGGFDPDLEYLEDWNLWVRYSLDTEFVFVKKLTSLFRSPYEAKQIIARYSKLDDYYQVAQNKHLDLPFLGSTIRDFISSDAQSKAIKRRLSIRRFLMKMPMFYHLLTKVKKFLR